MNNNIEGINALLAAVETNKSTLLEKLFIEPAHAFLMALAVGLGLVAIGAGIWYGFKSLSKSTLKVEGIPNTVNVTLPTEYKLTTDNTVTVNPITATANVNATGNVNTSGMTSSLNSTINSALSSIGTSITSALNRLRVGTSTGTTTTTTSTGAK